MEVLEPRLLKRIIVRTSRSDGHVEEKLVFHGLQTRRTNLPPKFRTLFQIIRLPPLVSPLELASSPARLPLTFPDYFLAEMLLIGIAINGEYIGVWRSFFTGKHGRFPNAVVPRG